MTAGNHIDDKTIERIQRVWTEGVSLSDMAARFNVSGDTLKKLAKRKGWPVHPHSKRTKERKQ